MKKNYNGTGGVYTKTFKRGPMESYTLFYLGATPLTKNIDNQLWFVDDRGEPIIPTSDIINNELLLTDKEIREVRGAQKTPGYTPPVVGNVCISDSADWRTTRKERHHAARLKRVKLEGMREENRALRRELDVRLTEELQRGEIYYSDG